MLKFWNKQDNLILPSGVEKTPSQIMNDYPFTKILPTVLEMSGPVTMAIDNLYTLKQIYGIDERLSDSSALAAIEEALSKARMPQPVEADNI